PEAPRHVERLFLDGACALRHLDQQRPEGDERGEQHHHLVRRPDEEQEQRHERDARDGTEEVDRRSGIPVGGGDPSDEYPEWHGHDRADHHARSGLQQGRQGRAPGRGLTELTEQSAEHCGERRQRCLGDDPEAGDHLPQQHRADDADRTEPERTHSLVHGVPFLLAVLEREEAIRGHGLLKPSVLDQRVLEFHQRLRVDVGPVLREFQLVHDSRLLGNIGEELADMLAHQIGVRVRVLAGLRHRRTEPFQQIGVARREVDLREVHVERAAGRQRLGVLEDQVDAVDLQCGHGRSPDEDRRVDLAAGERGEPLRPGQLDELHVVRVAAVLRHRNADADRCQIVEGGDRDALADEILRGLERRVLRHDGGLLLFAADDR
uniref:ATP synthase beta subunit n=1 Tax=Caenorhabditis tropicalis TaxID=1561998 RepID=A0A1I7SY29_9PELO